MKTRISVERASRIAGLLDISIGGELLTVSPARCIQAHLGLRLRRPEAVRRVRRMKGFGASWDPVDQVLRLPRLVARERRRLLQELATSLSTVASRPLEPRLVNAALELQNRERLRWTKDGRLPPAGNAMLRRGQLISTPVYAVDFIEHLLAHPEIVAAWRQADVDLAERSQSLAGDDTAKRSDVASG